MLIFRVIILFVFAFVTGCATTSPLQLSGIAAVEANEVIGCQYLDDVHGASGWYGVFANTGYQNARAEALRQAVSIGATHIVWVPQVQSYGSSQVHGKAYKCVAK